MRFPVPVEIEIPDGQLTRWAEATGVTEHGQPCARDAVDAVRRQVFDALRRDFGAVGIDVIVSIKGWSEPAGTDTS